MIKADVLGTIDAIEHELEKFESDRIHVRVIDKRVGNITSGDVQDVSATEGAIIVGFNVKVDRSAVDLSERLGVEIDTFDIIYELSDWLHGALKTRTPKKEVDERTGRAKILKHFSTQKHTHVLGGRVDEGSLGLGEQVKILRRDVEIGRGTIKNLQQSKSDTNTVSDGEFGMAIDSKIEVTPGDYIESFKTVIS
jgi:translation initiation factor IF-2